MNDTVIPKISKSETRTTRSRWFWFISLYLTSVITVASVVYGLKYLIHLF